MFKTEQLAISHKSTTSCSFEHCTISIITSKVCVICQLMVMLVDAMKGSMHERSMVCTDFVAIFLLAQNPLKLGIHCLKTERGRERGVDCHAVCSYFSACVKKKHGHFSHEKSQHGKFQQILSNLKNRGEIRT